MLKIVAATIAIGIALAGPAGAQTLLVPRAQMLLVKHDDEGPGRKLGHYKHWNKHAEKEWRRSYGVREYVPYYVPVPSYGSSHPPAVYGYPSGYYYGY